MTDCYYFLLGWRREGTYHSSLGVFRLFCVGVYGLIFFFFMVMQCFGNTFKFSLILFKCIQKGVVSILFCYLYIFLCASVE